MIDVISIFHHIRRVITRKDIIFVIFVFCIYFFTRTFRLEQLPIFTDEAIYIHWAKLAWKDAAWRFVSLTDGRQPLQTWATIPLLKLFTDPLIAGRMFGVASGFFGLIGFMGVSCFLFGKKGLYYGALLYVFNPMFLFYERMALADSAVTAFYIWGLFGSLLLVTYRRLDIALLWGLLMGLGTLTKSTVRLFLAIPLFAPLLLFQKNKDFVRNLISYFALYAISTLFALLIYNIQRLSPFMHFIEQKNTTFVRSVAQFIAEPLNPTIHNLWKVPYYVGTETGFFLILAGIAGLFLFLHKDFRRGIYLLLWLVIPYLVIASLAVVVFPRYLMFLVVPLLLGYSMLIATAKNLWKYVLISAYMLSVSIPFLFTLKNPYLLPFSPVDRGQYLEGETVGVGIPEIVTTIQNEAKKRPVVVYTEGTFGLLPYALDMYTTYDGSPISYEPRWPLTNEDVLKGQQQASQSAVFLILPKDKKFDTHLPLTLIKKFPRFGEKTSLVFYKIEQKKE